MQIFTINSLVIIPCIKYLKIDFFFDFFVVTLQKPAGYFRFKTHSHFIVFGWKGNQKIYLSRIVFLIVEEITAGII